MAATARTATVPTARKSPRIPTWRMPAGDDEGGELSPTPTPGSWFALRLHQGAGFDVEDINFSAGPATLPREVLAQAAESLLDWRGRA